jgi:hypothetical protein
VGLGPPFFFCVKAQRGGPRPTLVQNLSDNQPALIYENNTFNGNVDANTFDTIGRFYWARVTLKF